MATTINTTSKTAELNINSNNILKTKETDNFNNFLKLLTTELKNQDPLKPLDPTQTVTQLATFSTVEQAVQTNSLLNKLIESTSSIQSASLIGKTISTDQGKRIGVINSISYANTSPIAILDNGERVALSANMMIS